MGRKDLLRPIGLAAVNLLTVPVLGSCRCGNPSSHRQPCQEALEEPIVTEVLADNIAAVVGFESLAVAAAQES